MVYECTDRRGKATQHRLSSELTAKEAMERLGVLERPFTVVRWPEGRPDQAVTVQAMPR